MLHCCHVAFVHFVDGLSSSDGLTELSSYDVIVLLATTMCIMTVIVRALISRDRWLNVNLHLTIIDFVQ